MKDYLAKDTFREIEKTIREGKPLNPKIAEAVAHAMKEWAYQKELPTLRTGSTINRSYCRKAR